MLKEKDDLRIMPFSEKASFLEWLNADYYVEVKKLIHPKNLKFEVIQEEQESGVGDVRGIIKKLPKFESTTSDGKINVFFNLEADEEGRFVTETLAEIYFNQNYLIKQ